MIEPVKKPEPVGGASDDAVFDELRRRARERGEEIKRLARQRAEIAESDGRAQQTSPNHE